VVLLIDRLTILKQAPPRRHRRDPNTYRRLLPLLDR